MHKTYVGRIIIGGGTGHIQEVLHAAAPIDMNRLDNSAGCTFVEPDWEDKVIAMAQSIYPNNDISQKSGVDKRARDLKKGLSTLRGKTKPAARKAKDPGVVLMMPKAPEVQ